MWRRQLAGALFCTVCACGCNVNTSELLPVGTPFVVAGTMTSADSSGPCPVWIADNGESFYLYQDPLLDNATFDRVMVPGTRSRLVLTTRTDLVAPCKDTKAAEVQNVLEIAQ